MRILVVIRPTASRARLINRLASLGPTVVIEEDINGAKNRLLDWREKYSLVVAEYEPVGSGGLQLIDWMRTQSCLSQIGTVLLCSTPWVTLQGASCMHANATLLEWPFIDWEESLLKISRLTRSYYEAMSRSA